MDPQIASLCTGAHHGNVGVWLPVATLGWALELLRYGNWNYGHYWELGGRKWFHCSEKTIITTDKPLNIAKLSILRASMFVWSSNITCNIITWALGPPPPGHEDEEIPISVKSEKGVGEA